jgi:hypothetical protein
MACDLGNGPDARLQDLTLSPRAVELAHAARKRRIDGLDQQVVGGWQRYALLGANCVRLFECGVGVTPPVESLNGLRQDLKEALTIWINEEDLLASVAAARDVVERAGELNTQWACHGSVYHLGCVIARPDPIAPSR